MAVSNGKGRAMDGGATRIIEPHRFTVTDYHRMTEAGILTEGSRVELIRGQIVDMAAIGTPHFGMVNRLNQLLTRLVEDRGLGSVQNPVRLDDGSEPQPDVVILRPRRDYYETTFPRPGDVLLLIEVADSSLAYDRAVKAPLYADAGIVEYWIVDLVDRIVEVFREPANDRYAQTQRIGADGVLQILALPGAALHAADVLRTAGEANGAARQD